MLMTGRTALLLAAFMSALSAPLSARAAPDARLWPFWNKSDEASAATVDHSAWDRFLKTYIVRAENGVNLVRYGGVAPGDRKALAAYIGRLAGLPVRSFCKAEQKALWINLYNALTVTVILDHWPVKSIRDIDISPGLFADGPWGKKLLTVEGQKISLDDIEHRILRPIWKDPRIHYAVNCASIGCPNLARDAFTAANTNALLNRGAIAYVNHPRGAAVRDGRLTVSSIYKWFKADFGGSDAGVIAHLKRFARPPLKAQLETVRGISGDRYDWSVNAAR